jgi:hypothetical protein
MGTIDDKYIDRLRARYRKGGKKERTAILDEYVKTTGYHRKHAIRVLGRKQSRASGPVRRARKRTYGAEEAQALLTLSELFDGICAKLLRAAMDAELSGLYDADRLQVSPHCYEKLQRISPATIDRLLRQHRSRGGKSRGFTKPGTLLKHHIPIRTWADWTEDRPGFCELDLVDHSGGLSIRGADHAWSLGFTDVHTGWTECVAVRNKAQVHVFAAIQHARERLPFPLLGIDCDNGSEFINDQLYRYCMAEHITFTRGRVGNKNDNAYVEQTNWTDVRQEVGYYRYDTPQQLDLLNRLYAVRHFYTNFFLPTMRLKEKIRVGSKVRRKYDVPKTPYARVLTSEHVEHQYKAHMRETYSLLDLVDLRTQLNDLRRQLLRTVSRP